MKKNHKKNHVFFLILFGIAVLAYLNHGADRGDKNDLKLISIWEKAEGTIKRDLTPVEAEQLKKSKQDAMLQGTQKAITGRPVDLSSNGEVRPLTQEEVDAFVAVAIPTVMNFGFHNFDEKKTENAAFFTKRGFVSFYKAAERAQLKQGMERNQEIVEPKFLCVTQKNMTKDKYNRPVWIVTSVVEYTHMGLKGVLRENQLVEVVIMNKADESLKYQPGPGIRQWIARPEKHAPDKCRTSASFKPSDSTK